MQRSVLISMALLIAVLVSAGASTPAAASSDCGPSYIVQWGDTLGSVAGRCATSVSALRLANPDLGYWLYAGQTLWLPGAYLTAVRAWIHTSLPAATRSRSWQRTLAPRWMPSPATMGSATTT